MMNIDRERKQEHLNKLRTHREQLKKRDMVIVELEKQLHQKKMAMDNMNDEVTELRIHFEQTTVDHDD